MLTTVRRAALTLGLTVVAAAVPAQAAQPAPARAASLSCESKMTWIIGQDGPHTYSVRCSGNSSSAYWAEGACKRAGHQRGPTHFPPFVLPVPGPYSTIGCANGDYLISYHESHG